MYEIQNRKEIAHFFKDADDGLVLSCIQNHMGFAYATGDPISSLMIGVGVFVFFAGEANADFVSACQKQINNDFLVMTPMNPAWAEAMEQCILPLQKRKRYATKKEPDVFDITTLDGYIKRLKPEYKMVPIDKDIYEEIRTLPWAQDLCNLFKDADAYRDHGLGMVVKKGNEIVSGASSYVYYDNGIEIEIDTKKDERRNGLALACGAALVKECIARGIYPSWDAQNKGSLALAEKLGYHFKETYDVYEYEG